MPYALVTATPAQDSVPKAHVLDMEVWSSNAGNGPYWPSHRICAAPDEL
ncbi:hypothetical protein [Micromonospora sp. KC606]|nr:hypothetical protein [Micromonospora sp. KC606]